MPTEEKNSIEDLKDTNQQQEGSKEEEKGDLSKEEGVFLKALTKISELLANKEEGKEEEKEEEEEDKKEDEGKNDKKENSSDEIMKELERIKAENELLKEKENLNETLRKNKLPLKISDLLLPSEKIDINKQVEIMGEIIEEAVKQATASHFKKSYEPKNNIEDNKKTAILSYAEALKQKGGN